jgi:APA family basic amino acid/polyamine antiporter
MSEDPSAPPSRGLLPRVLGPVDAFTIVVGSIIGSGIFLKPARIAEALGNFWWILFVWIAVGLVTVFGAFAIAELSAMMPHAGGPYVYLRAAYGRAPAFLWGWTEFWIIRTASLGALASGCVVYLSVLAPMDLTQQEVATIAIIAGLSGVNYISTRWGASLQNATVFLKVAFLAGIVLLPFVKGKADPGYLVQTYNEPATVWDLLKGLGTAMLAVWWAYDGWINIGPVAEEVRNPQRNVPLALFAGMAAVMTIYIAVTIGYHLALPMEEVAKSKAVASEMFSKLLGPNGASIVALGVAFSTFGAANSNLIVGPRIVFAMARDGLIPKALKTVHETFQTPSNAVALQGVWTLILIHGGFEYSRRDTGGASVDDVFDLLTNFCIFGETVFYSMAVAAVFVLRRKMPDADRPYRAWGYPFTPAINLLAFVALLAAILNDKPRLAVAGTSIIAVGAIYYAWAVRQPAASAVNEA